MTIRSSIRSSVAPGYEAPTAIAWSTRNRSPLVRVPAARGPMTRIELRMPDPSCNPYLALAAMLAGGLRGIEKGLELEDALVGNAYTSDKPKVPHTLRAARDAFQGSALARETLGREVVDHYTNMADVELLAFESAVTDWELRRGFERM